MGQNSIGSYNQFSSGLLVYIKLTRFRLIVRHRKINRATSDYTYYRGYQFGGLLNLKHYKIAGGHFICFQEHTESVGKLFEFAIGIYLSLVNKSRQFGVFLGVIHKSIRKTSLFNRIVICAVDPVLHLDIVRRTEVTQFGSPKAKVISLFDQLLVGIKHTFQNIVGKRLFHHIPYNHHSIFDRNELIVQYYLRSRRLGEAILIKRTAPSRKPVNSQHTCKHNRI